PEEKRSKGGMLATVQTFGILLKDRTFMGIALTQAFISMCMFAYIAGSPDRKSTRLNSSHVSISYAVFCLKKKNSFYFLALLDYEYTCLLVMIISVFAFYKLYTSYVYNLCLFCSSLLLFHFIMLLIACSI